MGVDITGSVVLMGETEWESGSTINGNLILTEASTFKGMAPTPVPPPNTGDPCSTSPPPADKTEVAFTPGTQTVNGNKMLVMGGMLLQGDGTKPCQPMIAMSTQTVLNGPPVCTEVDQTMFMGILNGAGCSP